jgi:hypothetical protein
MTPHCGAADDGFRDRLGVANSRRNAPIRVYGCRRKPPHLVVPVDALDAIAASKLMAILIPLDYANPMPVSFADVRRKPPSADAGASLGFARWAFSLLPQGCADPPPEITDPRPGDLLRSNDLLCRWPVDLGVGRGGVQQQRQRERDEHRQLFAGRIPRFTRRLNLGVNQVGQCLGTGGITAQRKRDGLQLRARITLLLVHPQTPNALRLGDLEVAREEAATAGVPEPDAARLVGRRNARSNSEMVPTTSIPT